MQLCLVLKKPNPVCPGSSREVLLRVGGILRDLSCFSRSGAPTITLFSSALLFYTTKLYKLNIFHHNLVRPLAPLPTWCRMTYNKANRTYYCEIYISLCDPVREKVPAMGKYRREIKKSRQQCERPSDITISLCLFHIHTNVYKTWIEF